MPLVQILAIKTGDVQEHFEEGEIRCKGEEGSEGVEGNVGMQVMVYLMLKMEKTNNLFKKEALRLKLVKEYSNSTFVGHNHLIPPYRHCRILLLVLGQS